MLPWLTLPYTAAHLGFEAQKAAFRRFRIEWRHHQGYSSPGHRVARRYCSRTGNGRAETASRREEDSQKIGAAWETQQAG